LSCLLFEREVGEEGIEVVGLFWSFGGDGSGGGGGGGEDEEEEEGRDMKPHG